MRSWGWGWGYCVLWLAVVWLLSGMAIFKLVTFTHETHSNFSEETIRGCPPNPKSTNFLYHFHIYDQNANPIDAVFCIIHITKFYCNFTR